MYSYHWVKLYHEMLDDPKTARLSDNLWRRFIECILLAGEINQKGRLPSIADIAWRLRIEEESLKIEFESLARAGFIDHVSTDPLDHHWIVVNFEKRQERTSSAERMRRKRKRDALLQESDDTGDDNVTTRHIEERRGEKKKRGEKKREEEVRGAASSQETFTESKARRLLENVAGPISPRSAAYISMVEALLKDHEEQAVKDALKTSRAAWLDTPRKNGGGNYSPTNFGWVEWASTYLTDGVEEWQNTKTRGNYAIWNE